MDDYGITFQLVALWFLGSPISIAKDIALQNEVPITAHHLAWGSSCQRHEPHLSWPLTLSHSCTTRPDTALLRERDYF